MTDSTEKAGLKMLAVRLPGDVVDAVKAYATAHEVSLHLVIAEFVQNGIARDIGRLNTTTLSGNRSSKEAFVKYRKALERGEVIPWAEKKMLAVRINPDVMKAFKEYSTGVKKNMSLLVEEFIHVNLAERRGEVVDAQTLAFLTRRSASPFRAHKAMEKAAQAQS